MKAVVLFSGGVDSTTCLGMAIDKYGKENVIALSISYGQKHLKEIEASNKIAAYYGVEHLQMDLEKIFAYSDCSLLRHSDQEIPEESYAEQLEKTDGKPVSTYVPFRNGLFLSCAASIALSKECNVIYYGAHADDAAGNAYPDCSSAFFLFLRKFNQIFIRSPVERKFLSDGLDKLGSQFLCRRVCRLFGVQNTSVLQFHFQQLVSPQIIVHFLQYIFRQSGFSHVDGGLQRMDHFF